MTSDHHQFSPPTLKDGRRWDNMRIGLLGGSFNPPHAGHMHIARLAQAKFGLDFVWWIVTPQNPLKKRDGMAPYEERFANVQAMTAPYPRQMATHLEAELGTRYTYQTITALKKYFPKTEFIWICGMDNAHIFHKWDRWQRILEMMPITFIARPPATHLVKGCPIRLLNNISHRHKTYGVKTDLNDAAIYWLEGNKMLDISSTEIRKNK
ncbi:MAG TPA: nicotinate (nicotinamide) nucleotide adenylyltransferase [Alphaproteobacteria bacterium]|nr:nicotinate (nicotinamide) nucleotide adenylyltransferase [Alphaproteobacteria bacterium]